MSLEYITPVYDRTAADVVVAQENPDTMTKGAWNYTDLNRIENNTRYVADLMVANGITSSYISLNSKLTWTHSDIPTRADIDRIIKNVLALEALSLTGLEFESLSTGMAVTYKLANALEYNLEIMRTQELPAEDTYSLTVNNGSGSGYYTKGTKVTVTADLPPENKIFWKWTGDEECLARLDDVYAGTTIYTMSNSDDEITATYTTGVEHLLTIEGGTIVETGETSGYYVYGDIIQITADVAPEDCVFYEWLGDYETSIEVTTTSEDGTTEETTETETETISKVNPYAAKTSIVMPDSVCSVTAHFIHAGKHTLTVSGGYITSDDGDDESEDEDTNQKTTGSYNYKANVGVSASRDLSSKYEFNSWWITEGTPYSFDTSSGSGTLIMGDEDVEMTSVYKYIYASDIELQVVQASGSGTYDEGTEVDIQAYWLFDTNDYVDFPYDEDVEIKNTDMTLAECRDYYNEASENSVDVDDSDFCVTAWSISAALTEEQQRQIDPSYNYDVFTAGSDSLYPGWKSFIDDDGVQWYKDPSVDEDDDEASTSPWFYIADDAETETIQVSWETETEEVTKTDDDGEEISGTKTTYSFVGPNNVKYYYHITEYDDDTTIDTDVDTYYTISDPTYSPNTALTKAIIDYEFDKDYDEITPGSVVKLTITFTNGTTTKYTVPYARWNAEYVEPENDEEEDSTNENADEEDEENSDVYSSLTMSDYSYIEYKGGSYTLTLTIGTQETANPLTLTTWIDFCTGTLYKIIFDFNYYDSDTDPKQNLHVFTSSGSYRSYYGEYCGELYPSTSTVYKGVITVDGINLTTYLLDSFDTDPDGKTYHMYYNDATAWYYMEGYPKTYAPKVTIESILSDSDSNYGYITYPDGINTFCKNHIKYSIPDYDVELTPTFTYAPWRTIKYTVDGTTTTLRVRAGDICTISAPEYINDYTERFSYWALTAGGLNVYDSRAWTFTVTSNISYTAVYEDNIQYTVTCKWCTIEDTGETTGTYYRGETVNIVADDISSISEDEYTKILELLGYDLSSGTWYVCSFNVIEGSVGSWATNGLVYGSTDCSFIMGTSDIMICPKFNQKATLYLTNATKTSITAWCDHYSSGYYFTFVTPEEYYYFTKWSGDTKVINSSTSSRTYFCPTLAQGSATYSVVGECEYYYDPIYWNVTLSKGEFDEQGSEIYTADVLQGSARTIIAYEAADGYVFLMWEGDTNYVTNVYASTTTVKPHGDMNLTATYYQPDNPEYYTITVINGEASGDNEGDTSGTFAVGSTVTIEADEPADGYEFYKWTGDESALALLADKYSSTTTLTMPDYPITYTATYAVKDSTPTYTLTVNYGDGSGDYETGTEIAIEANEPSDGFEFYVWWGSGFDYVTNPYQSSTTITMPSEDITVSASYKEISTYQLYVTDGYGTGVYAANYEVEIAFNLEDTEQTYYEFVMWVLDSAYYSSIKDITASTTTFTMPAVDGIKIIALYKTYNELIVNYGTGDGFYMNGTSITITADEPDLYYQFDCWTGDTTYLTDPTSSTTTVTMGNVPLEVTATYKEYYPENDMGTVKTLESDNESLTVSSEDVTIVSGTLQVGMIITDSLGNIGVVTAISGTTVTIERKFNT